jgi:hypothetical protein
MCELLTTIDQDKIQYVKMRCAYIYQYLYDAYQPILTSKYPACPRIDAIVQFFLSVLFTTQFEHFNMQDIPVTMYERNILIPIFNSIILCKQKITNTTNNTQIIGYKNLIQMHIDTKKPSILEFVLSINKHCKLISTKIDKSNIELCNVIKMIDLATH